MTVNYEAVIKALRRYRERLYSSKGIRGKLTRLDRLIVKSRQNLSHIEDPNARRALELTRESREFLYTALYGYIYSYYVQNIDLEKEIIFQNAPTECSNIHNQSTNILSIDPSDHPGRQDSFKQLDEVTQTFAIPLAKRWAQKSNYIGILRNRGLNINPVCRFDIPSDIRWWKDTKRPYEKGNDSFYCHIISRHGSEIAGRCGLKNDADVITYLSRLAASTNEATCMQFKQLEVTYQNDSRVLQNEGAIVKLDTETHVGIILNVGRNGEVTPITAFIVNKGYLRSRVRPNAKNRRWE